METFDAVVIGSGPNGLTAAAYLAREGWSVAVLEQAGVAGGAIRSEELTEPGFVHDTFSAFNGLLHASPVFTELELDRRVTWAHFETPVSVLVGPHDGAFISRDADVTARGLEKIHPADGRAWLELWGWWKRSGRRLFDVLLSPIPSPRPAWRLLRAAGMSGLFETAKMQAEPGEQIALQRFGSSEARALLACGVSHGDLAVDEMGSAPGMLVLAMLAQDTGMPVPVGGAGRLAEGFAGAVTEAGGSVFTGEQVRRIRMERGRAVGVETVGGARFRARRALLADTGPGAMVRLAGEEAFPKSYLDGVRRFRYGSGVFKIDLALSGVAPWAAEEMREVGVVHVTGDLDAMARSAFEIRRSLLPREPLLVVGQQSLADPTRAPDGGQTLWIECHVPSVPLGDAASQIDAGDWNAAREPFLERCLARLEAHAPGLRGMIIGVSTHTPDDLEHEDPNLVGGDIGGGSSAIDQQLIFRPVTGWFRYRTPVKGLYLCSASAHPGGGVHGMVGRNAARRVLRDAKFIGKGG